MIVFNFLIIFEKRINNQNPSLSANINPSSIED